MHFWNRPEAKAAKPAGAALGVALSLLVPCAASAQIRTALKPATAIRLQAGELIRYYKVRPAELIDGIPYQVLIIVTTDSCTVKTNKWESVDRLNAARKADIKETIGYQDPKDFRRPYAPPEEPIDPKEKLDYYLSFRWQGKTITWNSVTLGKPQLPSLFDFLEVCHYLARRDKEPEPRPT